MSFLKVFVNLFHFNRTNWKAVALCFITATVFWLFSALNKPHSTNLRFPLEFEFDRDRYAPAGSLPENILINVSGNGWDLFRKSFGVKIPVLKISLERPTEVKKIMAGTLPPVLLPQMGGLQINYVALDTLHVQIDNLKSRKFKLTADVVAVTFRSGFGRISPIVILPDSVELNGPAGILNALPDSIVLKMPEMRLSSDFREELEVQLADHNFIKRNPPVVEVRFEVAELTEVKRKVELIWGQLPWGMVVEEDSAFCTFLVPQNQIEKFNSTKLTAALAVKEQKKGEARKYLPRVTGLDPFIKLSSIDSVQVKQH